MQQQPSKERSFPATPTSSPTLPVSPSTQQRDPTLSSYPQQQQFSPIGQQLAQDISNIQSSLQQEKQNIQSDPNAQQVVQSLQSLLLQANNQQQGTAAGTDVTIRNVPPEIMDEWKQSVQSVLELVKDLLVNREFRQDVRDLIGIVGEIAMIKVDEKWVGKSPDGKEYEPFGQKGKQDILSHASSQQQQQPSELRSEHLKDITQESSPSSATASPMMQPIPLQQQPQYQPRDHSANIVGQQQEDGDIAQSGAAGIFGPGSLVKSDIFSGGENNAQTPQDLTGTEGSPFYEAPSALPSDQASRDTELAKGRLSHQQQDTLQHSPSKRTSHDVKQQSPQQEVQPSSTMSVPEDKRRTLTNKLQRILYHLLSQPTFREAHHHLKRVIQFINAYANDLARGDQSGGSGGVQWQDQPSKQEPLTVDDKSSTSSMQHQEIGGLTTGGIGSSDDSSRRQQYALTQDIRETLRNAQAFVESRMTDEHKLDAWLNCTRRLLTVLQNDPLWNEWNALYDKTLSDPEVVKTDQWKDELWNWVNAFYDMCTTVAQTPQQLASGRDNVESSAVENLERSTVSSDMPQSSLSGQHRPRQSIQPVLREWIQETNSVLDHLPQPKLVKDVSALQQHVWDNAKLFVQSPQHRHDISVQLANDLGVLLDRLSEKLRCVQVGRVDVNTPDYRLVIDHLNLNCQQILPNHVRLVSETELTMGSDKLTTMDQESKSKVEKVTGSIAKGLKNVAERVGVTSSSETSAPAAETMPVMTGASPILLQNIHMNLNEMQASASEMTWLYYHRSGIMSVGDVGLADLEIGRMNIELIMSLPIQSLVSSAQGMAEEVTSTSLEGSQAKQQTTGVLNVASCRVDLHDLNLRIYGTRHNWVYTVLKPILQQRLRVQLKNVLEALVMQLVTVRPGATTENQGMLGGALKYFADPTQASDSSVGLSKVTAGHGGNALAQ